MNIFDFAMQMELDGKAFYQNLAAKTADPELAKVLTMLAEEEDKHYNIFMKLKAGEGPAALKNVSTHSETLATVKNIFIGMSNSSKHAEFTQDERSIWVEAMKIEEKSEAFYRENAGKESDPETKQLLTLIADEERNHIYLIDSVLTYMKFPETFADSSQFKDFQSLEGH